MRILHYPGSANVKRFDIINPASDVTFPIYDSFMEVVALDHVGCNNRRALHLINRYEALRFG